MQRPETTQKQKKIPMKTALKKNLMKKGQYKVVLMAVMKSQ